jgi:hypothetical protein
VPGSSRGGVYVSLSSHGDLPGGEKRLPVIHAT